MAPKRDRNVNLELERSTMIASMLSYQTKNILFENVTNMHVNHFVFLFQKASAAGQLFINCRLNKSIWKL